MLTTFGKRTIYGAMGQYPVHIAYKSAENGGGVDTRKCVRSPTDSMCPAAVFFPSGLAKWGEKRSAGGGTAIKTAQAPCTEVVQGACSIVGVWLILCRSVVQDCFRRHPGAFFAASQRFARRGSPSAGSRPFGGRGYSSGTGPAPIDR